MPSINKFHKHSSNVESNLIPPSIFITDPQFQDFIPNYGDFANNQNQRMKLKQGMGQDMGLGGLYI
jgi:hypothetical protein